MCSEGPHTYLMLRFHIFKFWIVFEQGTLRFYFALGPANYVVIPVYPYPTTRQKVNSEFCLSFFPQLTRRFCWVSSGRVSRCRLPDTRPATPSQFPFLLRQLPFRVHPHQVSTVGGLVLSEPCLAWQFWEGPWKLFLKEFTGIAHNLLSHSRQSGRLDFCPVQILPSLSTSLRLNSKSWRTHIWFIYVFIYVVLKTCLLSLSLLECFLQKNRYLFTAVSPETIPGTTSTLSPVVGLTLY